MNSRLNLSNKLKECGQSSPLASYRRRCVSASQCSFSANLKTLLKFKNLQGKLKKDFAFEAEYYSKRLVWKNLKFIWHSFQTSVFFLSRHNDNVTSQRVCSSLHIALNSSLSSIVFNFADIFILRNVKSLSKPCFSSL